MMTKEEIIRTVLRAIGQDGDSMPTAEPKPLDSESYEDIVIATLEERLPDVGFMTCDDFRHLQVACCDSCHTGYPHYDMYVEDVDGGKGWVCCSVRSAHLAMKAFPS